jgi:Ca2+:H+ antiporter
MVSTTRDGDEIRRLDGFGMDSSIPPWRDNRWWIRRPAKTWRAILAQLTGDYLNLLLIFLPFGIIAGAMGWNAHIVFALNSLALVPLPGLLSFAVGYVSAYTSETAKGLFNVVLVNMIPLIVSSLNRESRHGNHG